MDLKELGNQIADIHNMMNDLEIRGGKNAKIVVYVQEQCKKILKKIETEAMNQHAPQMITLFANEQENTDNDDHGCAE